MIRTVNEVSGVVELCCNSLALVISLGPFPQSSVLFYVVRSFGCLLSEKLEKCFGGLVVSMLASGTQDRGFAPDRSRRIFLVGKIHSIPSFGGEVK
jgi:hypothetical protein